MTNQILQTAILVFLIVSVPILTYLSSWRLLFYDSNLYSELLTKNNAHPNAVNISNQWLDFFRGKITLASITDFTDLERQHMQDVKELVNNLELFLIALLFIFIALLFVVDKKSEVFFYGGILTMLLPIILYLIPFDTLFDLFHKLFFTGNWQFPADSLLIQTFPESFFYDFTFRIFRLAFAIGFIATLTAWRCRQ